MRTTDCTDANQRSMNTGISILRIIAMVWVILFHFADHGVTDMIEAPFNISWIMLAFGRMGGGIGNCIFVLVTGYVLYGQEYKLYRIIKLWLEIFFYSIVLGCISYILNIQEITFLSGIRMLFPIISREYWYMSSYFALYLLYPFILNGISFMDKKYHKNLLLILLFLFSLLPTFSHAKWLTGSGNLSIFITLFLIGSYVRKYENTEKIKIGRVLFLIITILITWTSEVLLKLCYPSYSFYMVWEMWKFPVVIIALQLFLIFIKIGKKLSDKVNIIAQSVFGVYLLHMGSLKDYLFKEIIDNSKTYNSPIYLCTQMILSTILIFVICILIDRCRIKLLGRIEIMISDYVYKKIQPIETKIYGFYKVNKKILVQPTN